MPKSKREPIPKHFRTLEEAGEFWDTHDLGDYWDQTEEVAMSFRRKSSTVERPKAQKAQKVDEAQVFEAFLQAFPSLKASIASWEQPEKEPPDILCHVAEGRMRN